MLLPWDAQRITEMGRRADRDLIRGAASPYNAAGRRVLGALSGAATAAAPTRGALGAREATLAAAPELARLREAGVMAEGAARRTAANNEIERERERAESATQLLGMGLNAGGGLLASLTGAMGGGGTAPAGRPSSGMAGPSMGSLVQTAAPIAGMAMGGPLGGAAGSALGARFNPFANPGSMALGGTAPMAPPVASMAPGAPVASLYPDGLLGTTDPEELLRRMGRI